MKFLILFALGALFGSVQCDQECFRAMFKECVKQPVPGEPMTLCGEILYQLQCVSRLAFQCNMPFRLTADETLISFQAVCRNEAIQNFFDGEKACYKRALNDSDCVRPINEAMSDLKTTQDFITANKKICKLFEPYSKCVKDNFEKNCEIRSEIFFNSLYDPLQRFSSSLCEHLIIPADEKDDRPDNFGMLNVFATVAAIFFSA